MFVLFTCLLFLRFHVFQVHACEFVVSALPARSQRYCNRVFTRFLVCVFACSQSLVCVFAYSKGPLFVCSRVHNLLFVCSRVQKISYLCVREFTLSITSEFSVSHLTTF